MCARVVVGVVLVCATQDGRSTAHTTLHAITTIHTNIHNHTTQHAGTRPQREFTQHEFTQRKSKMKKRALPVDTATGDDHHEARKCSRTRMDTPSPSSIASHLRGRISSTELTPWNLEAARDAVAALYDLNKPPGVEIRWTRNMTPHAILEWISLVVPTDILLLSRGEKGLEEWASLRSFPMGSGASGAGSLLFPHRPIAVKAFRKVCSRDTQGTRTPLEDAMMKRGVELEALNTDLFRMGYGCNVFEHASGRSADYIAVAKDVRGTSFGSFPLIMWASPDGLCTRCSMPERQAVLDETWAETTSHRTSKTKFKPVPDAAERAKNHKDESWTTSDIVFPPSHPYTTAQNTADRFFAMANKFRRPFTQEDDPDGEFGFRTVGKHKRRNMAFEAKCPSTKLHREISRSYYCQMQIQMLLTGLSKCMFSVMFTNLGITPDIVEEKWIKKDMLHKNVCDLGLDAHFKKLSGNDPLCYARLVKETIGGTSGKPGGVASTDKDESKDESKSDPHVDHDMDPAWAEVDMDMASTGSGADEGASSLPACPTKATINMWQVARVRAVQLELCFFQHYVGWLASQWCEAQCLLENMGRREKIGDLAQWLDLSRQLKARQKRIEDMFWDHSKQRRGVIDALRKKNENRECFVKSVHYG